MIHPSADVAADASVGSGTRIWHRAQVREGAAIGVECVIGRDVYIDAEVVIGDRVKIQNGALLYRGVTVESGVFIGPGAILTNDRHPRSVGSDGDLLDTDGWVVTPTHLEHGSSIGAGAIVVAGADVGRFAMVGAGAVVTRPVPAHALVVGNPARQIGWVCACGRRLDDEARCQADGRQYRIERGVCSELLRAATGA